MPGECLPTCSSCPVIFLYRRQLRGAERAEAGAHLAMEAWACAAGGPRPPPPCAATAHPPGPRCAPSAGGPYPAADPAWWIRARSVHTCTLAFVMSHKHYRGSAKEARSPQPRQQASSEDKAKTGKMDKHSHLERVLLLCQKQGYERKADPTRNPAANRHIEGCFPAPHVPHIRACTVWLWSFTALLDTC